MPYPNEHSCRLEDPKQFDEFNLVNSDQEHDGKRIDVIYGIKDNKSKIQALRYPKNIWSEESARSHCKSRKGTFEAAAGKSAKKLTWLREAKEIGETAPEWFQLFPPGEIWIEGEDESNIMDAEGADLIIANFESRTNDMVIDYEHQTLENVQAPAAGWIKQIEWRGDDPQNGGLWLHVKWTKTAATYIENREYRYFSPVFWWRLSDRKIIDLYNVALTNQPKMMNITQALAAKQQVEERRIMMLDKLKKALGLKESATEDEVLQLVTAHITTARAMTEALAIKPEGTQDDLVKAIKAKIEKPPAITEKVMQALGVNRDEDEDAILAKIKALGDKSGKAGDAQAELVALKKDHEDLKTKWKERDRDERVDRAIAAGKITPAQKDWALEYALKDPEGFDGFVAKQPVVVPLEELKKGGDGPSGTPAEKMAQLIAKKQAENKDLSYKDAMTLVSYENPELAEQYIEASRY